jgi:hypothetical protein
MVMPDDERNDVEEQNADLLPPREVMSLLNTDPSAYGGLMGDPTATGPDASGTTAGASDVAGSAVGQANDLAAHHPSGDGSEHVSDQPQTIPGDSSQTASSET